MSREGLARQGHARGQGVHASSAPPLDLGSLCPMRARALAGDRELTVKLQVSRPTRDRAPGPSQCGSACSNPVGATNHHQHNQLGGQSCRDDSVGVHAKDDHARDLARDLPETALHVTSRRLTTPPSTAPLTSVVVWAREVLRGVVNSPSINGKDGVAGSSPAGGSTPNQQVRAGSSARPVACRGRLDPPAVSSLSAANSMRA